MAKSPRLDYDRLTEQHPGQFLAEASDLGFDVGEWPDRVLFERGGVSDVFLRSGSLKVEGELQYVVYGQLGGPKTVRVFND